MKRLRILADENIPMVHEIFDPVGEIVTAGGRSLIREDLKEIDVLLVRSVTRVDADLLSGTPVSFVGTATIGVDHVDLDYLNANQIGFASAPGSNAESVACYVVATLLELANHTGRELRGQNIAIVGVGNVGRRVKDKALALGMRPLLVDPLRARLETNERYMPLQDALGQADWVTTHTPLTRTGEWPTYKMFNSEMFARCRFGAIFLNSGRGDTVHEDALLDALRVGRLSGAALDVWPGEPEIGAQLLNSVQLASPHIAGYAVDGKLRGTVMLAAAVNAWLERPSVPSNAHRLEARPVIIGPGGHHSSLEGRLREVCRSIYDIRQDDRKMRQQLQRCSSEEERRQAFDLLRRQYPVRREFGACQVEIGASDLELLKVLSALGFGVSAH